MTAGSHIQSFESSNLPTNHVTVYGDRAEVNKIIKASLKKGVNEVVVTKLSRSLDSDSIRVEGHGKAIITEVKYQEKIVTKDEEVKEKEKKFHEEIKKWNEERKRTEQNVDRLNKQKKILDGIANQLGQGGNANTCGKEKHDHPSAYSVIINNNGLENLGNFLTFHEKRTSEVDHSLNDLRNKLDKINEQISVANSNLSDAFSVRFSHVKEVTIFVTADEQVEAALDLFYVVYNASWKPSYDMRVQTDKRAIKVTYYGLIEQNTDEDWKDTNLTLSTATPRVGGQIPELGTTKVSFYKPPLPRASIDYPMVCGAMGAGSSARSGGYQPIEKVICYAATPLMDYVQAVVKENVTSTAFDIENATSVPSDNSSHKVTISMIDLKPTFEYETIPGKSTYAYFKAKVTNSSQCPFLAGPTAIFVNESFVANGSMKSVNPSEQFDVSLGVDPSIKIEYKAAKKFHEESGILSKSSIMTKEQKIGLHNTKSEAVRLTIIESLPQSTEEKLKITLLEPVLNKNEKLPQVVLNKNNNIEWQMNLAANEKKELVLKYQLEHPKGEQLEYNEE